jgi:hypothetical protein
MTEKARWTVIMIFAVAMAYVEAAVVLYLRVLVNQIDPYPPNPLAVPGWLVPTEIAREAATVTMLLAVGWLAGRTWRSRLGHFFIAFGVWDLFYYVFLRFLTGWPRTLLDWDILFLIPLPWWGPVLAPTSIAALMIVGGTLMSQVDHRPDARWPGRWLWTLSFTGAVLALYVFMADSIEALSGGLEAIRQVVPTRFNWPLFTLALALMAAPLLDMVWPFRSRFNPKHLGSKRSSGRTEAGTGHGM